MLICTPGRLLQHMDETSYFYASDLQMLSKFFKYLKVLGNIL